MHVGDSNSDESSILDRKRRMDNASRALAGALHASLLPTFGTQCEQQLLGPAMMFLSL